MKFSTEVVLSLDKTASEVPYRFLAISYKNRRGELICYTRASIAPKTFKS
jgi:hypothetical protein